MRTLLGIVAAVLAAIAFSFTYLIVLALESRRDPQTDWTGVSAPERATTLPSKRDF